MTDPREVKVKLIADTREYEEAMARAAKATREAAKALRRLNEIRIIIRTEREES